MSTPQERNPESRRPLEVLIQKTEKTAVGNGGPRRMTRNSLKAARVSDLSQHIEDIDSVDDGRAESGLTQPQTVFQLHEKRV
jgi:hypothetical protein